MCGIVGIFSPDTGNLSAMLYKSIKFLQHRGQDSYGYSDGKSVEKYMGMIEHAPKKITNNIGLAHTRYRTSGNVSLEESQPFLYNDIAFVHNGNVKNDDKISDSFGLLKMIKDDNIITSIRHIIENYEGAFFVIIIHKNKLYAFKDKYGIRPGVYGKNGKGEIIVASENNGFKDLGFEFVDDIKPGEIFVVGREGKIERNIIEYNLKPCIFEFIYLSNSNSILYGLSVSDFRINMANKSYELIKNFGNIDAVCGIPSSSRIYALELARLLKKPYFEPIVKKKRSFILPTQEEREEYLNTKYTFLDQQFEYSSILLADDSIVRGTTAKFIIKKFRENGCDNIYFLSFSPKVVNKNLYGINITTKKELVSYERTHQEIEQYLGCDKLVYQSIENLYECSKFKDLELSIFY